MYVPQDSMWHFEVKIFENMALFGLVPRKDVWARQLISRDWDCIDVCDAWARQLPKAVNFQGLGLDWRAWAMSRAPPCEATIQTPTYGNQNIAKKIILSI